MNAAGKGEQPMNRFAVPLAALEDEAHVEQADMVEELSEPPTPSVYDPDVAQLNRVIGAGG